MAYSPIVDFSDKFVRLLKERSSLIWLRTNDYDLVSGIVHVTITDGYDFRKNQGIFRINKDRIMTWSIAYGQNVFDWSLDEACGSVTLDESLLAFVTEDDYDVLLLNDVFSLLTNGTSKSLKLVSMLQQFAYENNTVSNRKKSIVIVSPYWERIPALDGLVDLLEEPLPDEHDIEHELGFDIEDDFGPLGHKRGKYQPKGGRYCFSMAFMKRFDRESKKLVSSLRGLKISEIRNLMHSIQTHSLPVSGEINLIDSVTGQTLSERICEEKKRIVKNSGLLQVIDISIEKQKERVGNIDNLKNYLQIQKKIIDNIENYDPSLPKPKGVLLVGAPGCGKSETAKSIAAILEKPLLRLDFGQLMGQYVGVSEHNLIDAIAIAEAAHPCVLWIDEIEKAFAGFGNSESDNDMTVVRMVGYFLTWMQERKSMVYLVATANNLDNLRPELLRKGRWDKIMYLSYPDEKGIKDIFTRCMKKYNMELNVLIDSPEAASLFHTMYEQEVSGADIDSIIVEVFNSHFEPFGDAAILNVNDLMNSLTASKILEVRKKADEEKYRESVTEFILSSGRTDLEKTEDELISEAELDYKLHTGRVLDKNEKDDINTVVKRKLADNKRILDIIRSRVVQKNRSELEKLYKLRGYESASNVK